MHGCYFGTFIQNATVAFVKVAVFFSKKDKRLDNTDKSR